MLRRGLELLAVHFCISVCAAIQSNGCSNQTLLLSLYGIKNSTGVWSFFYDFGRDFCDSTQSWRLDFVQDWNSAKKIRLKGSYRERIPEAELKRATPIQFSADKKTILITRKEDNSMLVDGTSAPEAHVLPAPELGDNFNMKSAAISETDALSGNVSKSAIDQHRNKDNFSRNQEESKVPVKEKEDDTNNIDKSSQFHSKKIETNLEEQPREKNVAVLGGNYTVPVHKSRGETNMKIFTREEWKALDPGKEFETFWRSAKYIYVTQTNIICPDAQGCFQVLRKMQRVLRDCYGDLYSNFYIDNSGRTYEGLGWKWMRSGDSIYIHFLTDGWNLPSSETFASFALLLWEGTRTSRVSKEFILIENKHLTKSFQKELLRWVQWSKRMQIG